MPPQGEQGTSEGAVPFGVGSRFPCTKSAVLSLVSSKRSSAVLQPLLIWRRSEKSVGSGKKWGAEWSGILLCALKFDPPQETQSTGMASKQMAPAGTTLPTLVASR